jgi:hypothetical protein
MKNCFALLLTKFLDLSYFVTSRLQSGKLIFLVCIFHYNLFFFRELITIKIFKLADPCITDNAQEKWQVVFVEFSLTFS